MLARRLLGLYAWLLFTACTSATDLRSSTASGGGSGTPSAGSGGAAVAGSTSNGIGGLVVTPEVPPDEVERSLPTCVSCSWASCPDGKRTTVSGIVRTPAKLNPDPLYNAVVYVPGAPLEPFAEGVTCDRCGNVSGKPLAAALSDSKGAFKLDEVPAGTGVPLVLQMGRWRRQVTLPEIVACQDNPLPEDLTRFPRNRSEGDIPRIALVTSTYDPEECILRKMGIDDAEFTLPSEEGRIHLYAGTGARGNQNTPSGSALWSDASTLHRYDMVLLPCASTPERGDAAEARAALAGYADAGGRVFATDLSDAWLTPGSPFMDTVSWAEDESAGTIHATLESAIDTTFPKGQALADWLYGIDPSTSLGQITLEDTYHRADSTIAPTQRWLYSTEPATLQSFTFNTPLSAPAEQQCGRFAYSSFHIAGSTDFGDGFFPGGCDDKPLTAQERVLEFMLFDLASCVQVDTGDPKPPVVVK